MATLQRRFSSNKGKQVRRNSAGSKQGCGDDTHMLCGSTGSGSSEYLYRSLVSFVLNWTGMARVIKVELYVRTLTNSTHFSVGSKPQTIVHRATSAFTDGTNGENVWTSGEYQWPGGGGGVTFDSPINPATGKPTNLAWVAVDVTGLLYPAAPKGLPIGNTVGQGLPWYGLLLRAPGTEKIDSQRMIFYSFDRSGSTNDPYLLVTYDTANQPPTAPTLIGPGTTDNSFGDSFTGQHNDPDLDPMSARVIEVYPAAVTPSATTVPTWELPTDLQTAGSDETQTGVFSVPLSLAVGSLKLQTPYKWRAATRDSGGLPAKWRAGPGATGAYLAAYSPFRDLLITSSAPSVVATDLGTVPEMAGAIFGGVYSDPQNNALAGYVIQMKGATAHSDGSWADESQLLWNTGEVFPSGDEVTTKLIQRPYAGAALSIATYTYRIRVKDSSGSWSAWAYDDFSLTGAYATDPGTVELTTQVARNAPVRVALYSVFTDITHTTRAAGRGPGYLIGYIDDPMDLGASSNLNAGGEVYFTLPALHPYCPEVEPHQTHYQIQQWYGDRYRTVFAGIITDFDADPDTAVFYGTDYLGLLQTAVDERYNPANERLAANGTGGGGSYYSNQTIDYIVRDQLNHHKGLADSPVGFITIPAAGSAFSVLPERATIYSTYSEALPFIGGLIDSHKQGTGREARFYARPKDTTFLTWEWALIDNWGKDRPNIRLEYGGLLNDFRVVALGDFGTRVLGVGQKRGEVKVYRKTGTGALPETTFGRRAKTRFYADIIDENDLQRRVNEDASQLAKVGKRIALAIRADVLAPFDGWDLGDSIVVDIDEGIVQSIGYGSGGYWTIYGMEWRYYSDGHSDLNLTVLPKKTLTTPPTELIPSINPGVPLDWQVNHGVPVSYGLPLAATPPPAGAFAVAARGGDQVTAFADDLPLDAVTAYGAHYQDLNTGCIYELDQNWYEPPDDPAETPNPNYGQYTLVSCPEAGPPGPAGPPGGGVINVGRWRWSLSTTPPGTGRFGINVQPPAAGYGTSIQIHETDQNSDDRSPYIDTIRIGDSFVIDDTVGHVWQHEVIGDVIDNGTWRTIPIIWDDRATTTLQPAEIICDVLLLRGAPAVVDTTAPNVPTIKGTPVSTVTQQDDGTSVIGLSAVVGYDTAHPAGTMDDLAEYVLQSTRFTQLAAPTLPDWTRATEWVVQSEDSAGAVDTTIVQPGLQASVPYWLRVAARDRTGNISGWSSPDIKVFAAADPEGPPPPQGITTVPGNVSFAVRWDAIEVPDVAYVEVQWKLSTDVDWVDSIRVVGTITVVAGVLNSTADAPLTYNVRLRSVDTSGNVQTGALDGSGNPISGKATDLTIGWVSAPDVSPSGVPSSAVVWEEADIDRLFAHGISADDIVAGTLHVGGAPNTADAIEVYDAGDAGHVPPISPRRIGRWTAAGIEIEETDPTTNYRLALTEAGLTVKDTVTGVVVVSIGPLGIDAASVTFGLARGGHNLVQNSSFEMGTFAAAQVSQYLWDLAADWNASRVGADTNITTGASTLTMTTV